MYIYIYILNSGPWCQATLTSKDLEAMVTCDPEEVRPVRVAVPTRPWVPLKGSFEGDMEPYSSFIRLYLDIDTEVDIAIDI